MSELFLNPRNLWQGCPYITTLEAGCPKSTTLEAGCPKSATLEAGFREFQLVQFSTTP